jgi:hypothetical protein
MVPAGGIKAGIAGPMVAIRPDCLRGGDEDRNDALTNDDGSYSFHRYLFLHGLKSVFPQGRRALTFRALVS